MIPEPAGTRPPRPGRFLGAAPQSASNAQLFLANELLPIQAVAGWTAAAATSKRRTCLKSARAADDERLAEPPHSFAARKSELRYGFNAGSTSPLIMHGPTLSRHGIPFITARSVARLLC